MPRFMTRRRHLASRRKDGCEVILSVGVDYAKPSTFLCTHDKSPGFLQRNGLLVGRYSTHELDG